MKVSGCVLQRLFLKSFRHWLVLAALCLLPLGLCAQSAAPAGGTSLTASQKKERSIKLTGTPVSGAASSTLSQAQSASSRAAARNASPLGGLGRVVLILIVLLGGLYAALLFIRRRSNKTVNPAGTGPIDAVASYSLGGGKTVYVLKIAETYRTIGVSPSQICDLGALTDEQSINALELASSEVTSLRAPSFRSFIPKSLRRPFHKKGSGSGFTSFDDLFKGQRGGK